VTAPPVFGVTIVADCNGGVSWLRTTSRCDRVQRFEVRLTDDLSDTEIPSGKGETVTFSLDGTSYEIDLTAKNRERASQALRPYIEAGRPIQGSRRRRPVRTKGRRRCSYRHGVGSRQWLPGARARASAE
jgi:hypothetical protein